MWFSYEKWHSRQSRRLCFVTMEDMQTYLFLHFCRRNFSSIKIIVIFVRWFAYDSFNERNGIQVVGTKATQRTGTNSGYSAEHVTFINITGFLRHHVVPTTHSILSSNIHKHALTLYARYTTFSSCFSLVTVSHLLMIIVSSYSFLTSFS